VARRLSVLLLIVSTALGVVAAGTAPRGAQPVRVLFVGNSYTYFHNLPEMFAALASAGGRPVETRMVAPGGYRLKDHWEKGEARKALAERTWDFVVLQDQSTLGVTLFVDGKARVSSDRVFRPSADEWAAEIRKAGARPAFYLTWARKASPEDQDTLTHAYMSAARASRALVSPVGIAWRRVQEERPAIELFEPDGSHPSPSGTYLAACTFYAALFDEDPRGLPETVTGQPVDLETEQVQAGKRAVLAKLSAEHARVMQHAAWQAWQEVKKSGGYIEVKPLSPGLPPLPAPRAVAPAALAGDWTGTLVMHPAGPIDMVLSLEKGAPGWSGRIELKAEKPDAASVADLVVADGDIRFVLPASTAIAGLRVQFRGVAVSATELRGTAEAAGTDPDAPLRLLGSWRLTK